MSALSGMFAMLVRGHVAARCPMEMRRSPRRRRVYVRSKQSGLVGEPPALELDGKGSLEARLSPQVSQGVVMDLGAVKRMLPNRTSLSLSLSPEIYDLRKELAKVAILSIVGGTVNEASVLEVIPSIINAKIAGLIMPLNGTFFLVPFSSKEEVREVVKLGKFDAVTKDGLCMLNLAHWTEEIGAEDHAADEGQ